MVLRMWVSRIALRAARVAIARWNGAPVAKAIEASEVMRHGGFWIPIASALQAGVGIGICAWTGLLFAPEKTIEWMNVIVLLGGLACIWRVSWQA